MVTKTPCDCKERYDIKDATENWCQKSITGEKSIVSEFPEGKQLF